MSRGSSPVAAALACALAAATMPAQDLSNAMLRRSARPPLSDV